MAADAATLDSTIAAIAKQLEDDGRTRAPANRGTERSVAPSIADHAKTDVIDTALAWFHTNPVAILFIAIAGLATAMFVGGGQAVVGAAALTTAVAVALITTMWLDRRAVTSSLSPANDALRRLRRIELGIAAIGTAIVFIVGLSTQYFANPTFGWTDYLALLGWGFGFTELVSFGKAFASRATLT